MKKFKVWWTLRLFRYRRRRADRMVKWLRKHYLMPLQPIQFMEVPVFPSSPDDRYVPQVLEVRHTFTDEELRYYMDENLRGPAAVEMSKKRFKQDVEDQLFAAVADLMRDDIGWYNEKTFPLENYGHPMIGARLIVMVKRK